MSIETAPTTFLRPGDHAFDQARQAFNLTVDQRPVLIAHPADEHEVIALVREARERGLRVAAHRPQRRADQLGAPRPAPAHRRHARG
jgi:hypothetical protein